MSRCFSSCNRVLNTSMSPSSNCNVPAITLNSVVLPQPEGPTTISISPMRASKSTPLSACIRASPVPNVLLTFRTWTARRLPLLSISATKHHRWFEFIDFADAQERREGANEQNDDQGKQWKLVWHQEWRLPFLKHGEPEQHGQAHAQPVADQTDRHRLQQEHPREQPVAGSHRLQRAEMFQVLQHERIKCLPRDRHPDNKSQQDRGAE